MTQLAIVQDDSKSIALHTWDDVVRRAEFFSKSQLIPESIRGKPHDIAIILQMGIELGIDPLQAINGVNVIKGKPSVSPELAIALIRSRLPSAFIKFNEVTESKASVTMARSKDDQDQGFTSVWTMQRAQTMGLADTFNYKKQPGTMLKWRAVGEAARTVFPDLLKGIYVDEELDHLPDAPTGSKAKAIAQAIEPKEVTSEVLGKVVGPKSSNNAPDAGQDNGVLVGGQESEDILGDYVVPVECRFKGMRLKDIAEPALIDYLDVLAENEVKTGKPFQGQWLEFITRADQFLEREGLVG